MNSKSVLKIAAVLLWLAQIDSAFAQANQDLSNLTSPTAINQDLIFDAGATGYIKTKDDSGSTFSITLQSGVSSGDASGSVDISTGASGANGSGSVNITTGGAFNPDVPSGAIQLLTGSPTGTGNSGYLLFSTGSSVDGDSGNIEFQIPTPAGMGNRGHMTINTGYTDFSGGDITNLNRITTSGSAPSMGACGTSPSIAGNDSAGRITVGTGGAATSCAITFNRAWAAAPVCFVSNQSAIIPMQVVATTTTLTISASAAFAASSVLAYHCVAY